MSLAHSPRRFASGSARTRRGSRAGGNGKPVLRSSMRSAPSIAWSTEGERENTPVGPKKPWTPAGVFLIIKLYQVEGGIEDGTYDDPNDKARPLLSVL